MRAFPALLLLLAAACWTSAVPAAPWADPGDVRLRHEIELLRDEGGLGIPVTTWPLSWPDIARALERIDEAALEPAAREAYLRLRRRVWREARRGWGPAELSLRGAARPIDYRWFADTPRERLETGAAAEWLGDRTAVRVRLTVVSDPSDGRRVRWDGSYAGITLGNWMLSVGAQPRWWGPGWDGSLILSTNARPVPALAVQRKHSEPFPWPVLRWLGPWSLVFFTGVLEEGRTVPHALLTGVRVSFSPHPAVEVGLSRTAQWGGRGRPRDLDTFLNLMLGRDNRSEIAGGVAREPGNQLGGLDVRWRLPGLPAAAWMQLIGEDEAGGLPSRPIGQAGLALWGATGSGSWRLRLEITDTAVAFYRDPPMFNTAYNHGIYRSGYRYRGRSLGHGIDNDGRMLSVGGIWTGPKGRTLALTLRRARLNRDGAGAHPLAPSGERRLRADLELWETRGRGVRVGAAVSVERTTGGGRGSALDTGAWVGISLLR